MSRLLRGYALLTMVFGAASHAQAQTQAEADPAASALRSCLAHVERRDLSAASVEGQRAELLYRARMARAPRDVESTVALARALSQCQLPGAEMMMQGELSTQAMELLENALAIDSSHWTARFILASINFRSPSFLGRAPRAAAEFDILLRQQGDRVDNPRFARVFELRGRLHSQAGQKDSAAALWKRGASLFPGDSILVDLARRSATPAAGSSSTPSVAPATLNAVRVVASPTPPVIAPSTREVSKAAILSAPGGAADVLQAVQLQPGATRVTEGSDIYTRGGDPHETALLVDGSRVAGLSRFEGLGGGMFGAIEPFVVRSVRYSSGGFSVKHGNALSGVVEIETDGRPRERQMRAGASLVQASGTVRLPAGKRAGAWINARMSQTAALLATHGRQAEFQGAPHSEEVIASFIAAPSPTSELRATAIIEQDDARRIVDAAQWRGPFHSAGGARTVMLSSRWLSPTAPLVLRTNATAGDRRSDWSFGSLTRSRREQNGAARADLEWMKRDDLTIRAGVDGALLGRIDRGVLPASANAAPDAFTRILDGRRESTHQAGGYAELQYNRDAMNVTIGARADQLPGEAATTVDPRINIATRLGPWTARLAAGVFHQGRWRSAPVIPDSTTPADVAGAATHLVAGMERTGSFGAIQAEVYQKTYSNYERLGVGPVVSSANVRGLEVMGTRRQGSRFNGSLAYAWMDARLKLADGRTINSPFDITHSATAMLTTTITSNWSVGQTVRYGTGAPRTSLSASAPMDSRLDDYARLDLRLMRYIRQPKYLLTTFAEVINATNRHNVSGMTTDASRQREVPIYSFFATRTVVVGGEFQFR